MRDPRIVVQSPDPRFAQQNPRMVRIRALRITYTFVGRVGMSPPSHAISMKFTRVFR